MLSKKKKIFVLIGMVSLLVLTGFLNIFLNSQSAKANKEGGENTYGSLFATYRADRIATRDQTMLYLDAIIQNEASSAEAIAQAESQKLELTKNMEVELVLEGLIKALGFEDAFITNSTNNVNVIVKSETISEDEAMRILSVILDETEKTAQNVVIIPVK